MTATPPPAQDPRQALRDLLLRRLRPAVAGGAAMAPVGRDQLLPLSWQQLGLWFLYQWDPESATYHLPLVLRLRGELDLAALAVGLRAVLARHESLRTRFVMSDGQPWQVIDPPPATVQLLVAELSAEGWWDAVEAELRRPFRLLAEPAFRWYLGRISADEHVLVLNAHHIITDGWSLGILTTDLSSVYRQARARTGRRPSGGAAADGPADAGAPTESPELPPLSIQPADFAHWQRQHREQLDEGLAYWTRQLAGLPTLQFPADRPRPAVPTGAGASLRVGLDAALGRGVAALSGRLGVSPLAVLLAGFNLVLHRYTGEHDLPIGSVFSGRSRAELEPLIGYFANTVVLRTRLAEDATVTGHVQHCQDVILQAMQHQDTPFSLVVDTIQPARVPGQNPLFQISLSLVPATLEADLQLDAVSVTQLDWQSGTSRFDLTVHATLQADGSMTIWVEYSTELFDEWRIRSMIEHFGNVLASMLEDPRQRLIEIEPMSELERAKVSHAFNHHPDQPPPPLPWADSSVVAAFRASARAAAGACAVWEGGSWLSYAQLQAEATRLAVRLMDAGVRRGQVVGICSHRSLELVVGMLAVLLAGGAYLPLDPDQPVTRSDFQLADAGAVALLARPGLGPENPIGVCRIELELSQRPHAGDPDGGCDDRHIDVPGVDALPEPGGSDPAYLIYTSGSTGTPKGVLCSHAGLINRLGWGQARYPIDAGDRVLQKTPYTFDVSAWEFFWPLLAGARLVLAAPGGHRDPGYLATVLAEQRITVTHFVPSTLNTFLDQPELPELAALRHLFCSGEALPVEVRDRALRHFRQAQLHNLYGPTEAAIEITAWTCAATDGPTVVIGRPITNMQAYVLDTANRPVPIGVTGRLHLAGIGLAHGYLNRPRLTAERFVPCPFEGSGARMYDSGDLARWRPDGALEFHGRTDHQVKLNGQRIELGEIEHAFTRHPDVTAAAVTLVVPGNGRPPYLAAYLTTATPAPTDSALRSHLAGQLPLYMVPATITILDALPLGSSGKLDRSRLPAPDPQPAPTPGSAATGPTLDALTDIMTELLEPVRPLLPHHNFFAEGGSSLALARLTAAIKDRCGVQVSVRDLYLAPTLEAMARLVEDRSADRSTTGSSHTALVPLRAEGSRPPLFLVHPVGGSAVPYLPLLELLDPAQPVFAFEAKGLHGKPRRAGASLASIAGDYLAELRAAQPHGPYRLAGWSIGGMIAQQLAVQLRAAGEEVALLALLDSTPSDPGGEAADPAGLLSWFVRDVINLRGPGLPGLDPDVLRAVPAADQLTRAVDHLVEYAVIDGADRAAIAVRFEVFAELAMAFLLHRPVAVDRPIELLVTADTVPLATSRWRAVGGQVNLHPVPGDHYSMLQQPHLDSVAAVLGRLLDEACR